MLDLRRAEPRVFVHALSRAEETRIGADWIWWWEGRRRWFGSLVQAKKKGADGSYHLGYRPKSRPGQPAKARQLDALIRTGNRLGLPAAYALYRPRQSNGDLASSACPVLPFWPGSDGILILDALVAKWLVHLHGDRVPAKVRRGRGSAVVLFGDVPDAMSGNLALGVLLVAAPWLSGTAGRGRPCVACCLSSRTERTSG